MVAHPGIFYFNLLSQYHIQKQKNTFGLLSKFLYFDKNFFPFCFCVTRCRSEHFFCIMLNMKWNYECVCVCVSRFEHGWAYLSEVKKKKGKKSFSFF